jgi:hypothetical protein
VGALAAPAPPLRAPARALPGRRRLRRCAARRAQAILCNDCGKQGEAPFHFVYHKCCHCASYNTRVL